MRQIDPIATWIAKWGEINHARKINKMPQKSQSKRQRLGNSAFPPEISGPDEFAGNTGLFVYLGIGAFVVSRR